MPSATSFEEPPGHALNFPVDVSVPAGTLGSEPSSSPSSIREVSAMSESTRPKRVVIVDADNPLQEIHGEFFWREDHDRIVAAERQASYRNGYDHGFEAGSHQRPVTVVVRPRRRRRLRRLAVLAFVLFIVFGYTVDVLVPVLSRLV